MRKIQLYCLYSDYEIDTDQPHMYDSIQQTIKRVFLITQRNIKPKESTLHQIVLHPNITPMQKMLDMVTNKFITGISDRSFDAMFSLMYK